MSDKPKAVWTTVQPGIEVSEKGCLKFGRSMIMPKDLEILKSLNPERLAEVIAFAQDKNATVKHQKEAASYVGKLEALVTKAGANREDGIKALEEYLATLKKA